MVRGKSTAVLILEYQPHLYIIIQYLKYSKHSTMNPSKFIVKLTEMIKEFPKIINWSADGGEMEIFDIQRFQSEVYSKFFSASNYKSFVRQLNMYDFRRNCKGKNSASFKHELFKKGNQHYFGSIRRRKQKSSPKRSQQLKQALQNNRMFYPYSETSLITAENELFSLIREIRSQISDKGLYLVNHLECLLNNISLDSDGICQLGFNQQLGNNMMKGLVSQDQLNKKGRLMLSNQNNGNTFSQGESYYCHNPNQNLD